jgi:nicotinamidase-related amidase
MNFVADTSRTALLILDYQETIVDMVPEARQALLEKAAAALAGARSSGLKVIFVVLGFRPGYPEVSPLNKAFRAWRDSGRFAPGNPGTGIHPAVKPLPGEPVTTKHRVSAFSGSDLEMLLRAGGIDTLVLAGISTSGVVLSTLRQAADMDFRLVVLRDACADMDPQVHAVLMDKVFPRQAEVMDVDTFFAALAESGTRAITQSPS